MKTNRPLVAAEYLESIKRVIDSGETDLHEMNARLLEGGIVQHKLGNKWVSMRVENLPATIKALREEAKTEKKAPQARTRSERATE